VKLCAIRGCPCGDPPARVGAFTIRCAKLSELDIGLVKDRRDLARIVLATSDGFDGETVFIEGVLQRNARSAGETAECGGRNGAGYDLAGHGVAHHEHYGIVRCVNPPSLS